MADYFLKLDGVDGESTDSKHKGEIEVESFSWGATNTPASTRGGGGGGGGAGKVSMQDFHFVMRTSSASPTLMQAAANGKQFAKATLVGRKAGGAQTDFLKVRMADILISSFQIGGSAGGDVPMDQVSLNFSKIEIEVARQNADGSLS